MQGSIFSAVLADLLGAVAWPKASQALQGSPRESPGGSPKRSPSPAAPPGPSTAQREQSSASSVPCVTMQRSNLATAALASHPFRPLYLSGMARCAAAAQQCCSVSTVGNAGLHVCPGLQCLQRLFRQDGSADLDLSAGLRRAKQACRSASPTALPARPGNSVSLPDGGGVNIACRYSTACKHVRL